MFSYSYETEHAATIPRTYNGRSISGRTYFSSSSLESSQLNDEKEKFIALRVLLRQLDGEAENLNHYSSYGSRRHKLFGIPFVFTVARNIEYSSLYQLIFEKLRQVIRMDDERDNDFNQL